jgi:glycosyltransferase involved in cell wall biosynthesis
MNVCIVSNYKPSGYGESTRPGQLAKYLKTFGHQVLHICDWEGNVDGIEHIYIDRAKWETNPIKRFLSYIKNFLRILSFNPDLIYVHQFNNGRWAIKTKLFQGKKIVFDAHTSMYFEHLHFSSNSTVHSSLKKQENEICQSVNFIIAASFETKEFLQKTYSLDLEKIEAVGNATNIQPIETTEHTSNSGLICVTTLPQDGFASNIMALEMLLEIAKETYKLNKQIQFHVIGGGQMPLAKTPNVIFTGYIDDLRKKILSSDICLMPFPNNAVCGGARNKFCDYIALGKAVITTSEGLRGMEILSAGKNCLVANDALQFALTINNLAAKRQQIHALEEEVYLIRNYFNWETRARKVESILKQLI